MSCFACDRIEMLRRGENPHFIAELSESFWVLSDQQAYRGWSILLLKDHHEHLAAIPSERNARLWADVMKVASVLTRELQPVRINYENLGNQLHHIHWHVIPRYADDPQPTMPVWVRPPVEMNVTLAPADRGALVAQLRKGLHG